MKTLYLLIVSLFLSLQFDAQVIWLFDNASGLGDGTSWNDANNWTDKDDPASHMVPGLGDEVRLTTNDAIITGTVPAVPGTVIVGGGKTVTLDLDITIGSGTASTDHGIKSFNNAILNIADGRTVTVNVPTNKEGVQMGAGKTFTINVASTAILNISQSQNGILMEDATQIFNNDGTINITGATSSGIKMTNGIFNNNGIINITSSSTNGIVHDGGSFVNGVANTTASTTINGPIKDLMTVAANSFVNNAILDLTVIGTNSGDNAIDIALNGIFSNNSDGSITVDGGSGSARGISVVGTLNNHGDISLDGGNSNRTLSNDGGTIINHEYGYINLNATRMYNFGGTYTNRGYMFSTGTGLLNNAMEGAVATNEAFFKFQDPGSGRWSSSVGIDLDTLSNPFDFLMGNSVDINGSATGMATYDWYFGGSLAGSNNSDGILTLTENVFPNISGPHGLTIQPVATAQRSSTNLGELFSIDASNVSSSLLPVDFGKILTSVTKSKEVMLLWTTYQEINNDYFEVERSIDGKSFSNIGKVKGNGTSSNINSYEFLDRNPISGISYYRLRQVDFNGEQSFSSIVEADLRVAVPDIKLYPTLVEDVLILEASDKVPFVEIFNSNGQLMNQVIITSANQEVNVSSLPEGVYFVRYLKGSESRTKRFIKY